MGGEQFLPGLDNTRFRELTVESYDELRRIAAHYLRGERPDHTLQATALVHEAFICSARQRKSWDNREHVVAFAASAMRRILINYGRARTRLKRGGSELVRLPIEEAFDTSDRHRLNIEAVDEALNLLQKIDSRQAGIVQLRFFGGLTIPEVAEAMGLSPATVKRDWETAKLWLSRRLQT